jgi:hypothetical protein
MSHSLYHLGLQRTARALLAWLLELVVGEASSARGQRTAPTAPCHTGGRGPARPDRKSCLPLGTVLTGVLSSPEALCVPPDGRWRSVVEVEVDVHT